MDESSRDSDPARVTAEGGPENRGQGAHPDGGIEQERSKQSTGIEALDRKLDGGLAHGTIAVFSAAPASQSELLLYEFAANSESMYLATGRSASAVRDALGEAGADLDTVDVRKVDDRSPLADARVAIEAHTDPITLVIDQMGLFERQAESEYRSFLDSLEGWTDETGSVVYLHCLEGRGVADRRDLTLHMADVVFTLKTDLSGDRVVNTLAVPKFRGGDAFEDVIKLDLTGDVDIDLSRKIS